MTLGAAMRAMFTALENLEGNGPSTVSVPIRYCGRCHVGWRDEACCWFCGEDDRVLSHRPEGQWDGS